MAIALRLEGERERQGPICILGFTQTYQQVTEEEAWKHFDAKYNPRQSPSTYLERSLAEKRYQMYRDTGFDLSPDGTLRGDWSNEPLAQPIADLVSENDQHHPSKISWMENKNGSHLIIRMAIDGQEDEIKIYETLIQR